MSSQKTSPALAGITDEGLFELLATAILREANRTYHSLVHPGINAAGKTVKAPLDGICFVPGADPPHMIAVHHTTTPHRRLEKKWLHDPAKVRRRKGLVPMAPAGDLIKTAQIAAEERTRTPTLRVTLVLTTNEEPDERLVRAVEEAGRASGIEIDLWPRSRLTHFLDNEPAGQWIRYSFLHIDQELLSADLLHELSVKSVNANSPLDNSDAWIPRSLDHALTTIHRDVTFLVAGSGLGKSVGCYRWLKAHVEAGGCGIILPHEAVAAAVTLEQAVTSTLCQLHPSLARIGASVLSFCSQQQPLLLVVEDVNRSGQPQRLAEKIAGWSRGAASSEGGADYAWNLVCPLWPEVIASLGDQAKKRIEPLIISAGSFSEIEGRDAVLKRAQLSGLELSSSSAATISRTLGNDPLLIALHDQSKAPDPHQIISEFVEASLSRVAAAERNHPAADFRQALRGLAGQMLANRQSGIL